MTNNSQKILKELDVLLIYTKGYDQHLYASEIARKLKIPQKTVARKLENIQKKYLLSYERVGKNKHYFLNLDRESSFVLLQILENYKELLFLMKNSKLSLFINEICSENSIILFGSYAKGLEKKDSDVDMVIIGKENKKIKSIMQMYPFEFHSYFFTLAGPEQEQILVAVKEKPSSLLGLVGIFIVLFLIQKIIMTTAHWLKKKMK